MQRPQSSWMYVLAGLLAGCGDAPAKNQPVEPLGPDAGPSSIELASANAWQQVAASGDLFVHERADRVVCGADALAYELLDPTTPAYRVDTSSCGYATLAQETLADVRAGDQVFVRVWHFKLDKTELAQATLALAIGNEVVWEQTVDVPAEGGVVAGAGVVAHSAPAGTQLQFNLRNHGENQYYLLEVTLHAPRAPR